jgi:hypothetical protein
MTSARLRAYLAAAIFLACGIYAWGQATVAVRPVPVPSIAHAQVATSSSAGVVLAADSTRRRRTILIRNLDTSISVYIGGSTVTTGNGMLVKAGESITVSTSAAVYAVAASGTPTVAYLTEDD